MLVEWRSVSDLSTALLLCKNDSLLEPEAYKLVIILPVIS